MTERRLLQEWPLAAFTLAIQLACGISLATTVVFATHPSPWARTLAIAVFPIVSAGFLVSLFHLGHPLSAWRALTNRRSRLTLEILLTTFCMISSFVYSFVCLADLTAFRLLAGGINSILSFLTVIASASIYQLPARPLWNRALIKSSFIGSTLFVSALALRISSPSTTLAIPASLIGAVLLFSSGTRMLVLAPSLDARISLRPWLTCYLLLIASAPIVMFSLPVTAGTLLLSSSTVVLALAMGRLLMFSLAELEVRF